MRQHECSVRHKGRSNLASQYNRQRSNSTHAPVLELLADAAAGAVLLQQVVRAVDETRQVELQAIVGEQRRQTQRRHLLHGTAQAQRLDGSHLLRDTMLKIP